jgi:phage baseplate assembly protein gpV
VGASLPGKVIICEKDEVKVLFTVDETQKPEEAVLFPIATPYTAEGHTGWYWMPEPGDKVKVYFPNHDETKGYIISSLRNAGTDRTNDPEHKLFQTPNNKRMQFDRSGITISTFKGQRTVNDPKTGKKTEEVGSSLSFRLDQGKGIQISSDDTLVIKAAADFALETKNLEITAGELLEMSCPGSSVKMEKQKIYLAGAIVDVRKDGASVAKPKVSLVGGSSPVGGAGGTGRDGNKPSNSGNKSGTSKKTSDSGFIQFDNSGEGYSSVNRDPKGDDNWAKPEFISAVKKLAKRWHEIDSNNSIWFGDFSRKNGGPMVGHGSHQTGIDVDLYVVYKKANVCDTRYKTYNKEKCQKFVNLVKSEFTEFNEILFGDSTITGLRAHKGNIYKNKSLLYQHRHHFHLGF